MNNRQELQNKIVEKSMKDENFRQMLLENPVKTLNDEFGFRIPEGFQIKVLEEKSDQLYLVLPAAGADHTVDELSEAELDGVAGGSFLDCMTFYTCGGSACC